MGAASGGGKDAQSFYNDVMAEELIGRRCRVAKRCCRVTSRWRCCGRSGGGA